MLLCGSCPTLLPTAVALQDDDNADSPSPDTILPDVAAPLPAAADIDHDNGDNGDGDDGGDSLHGTTDPRPVPHTKPADDNGDGGDDSAMVPVPAAQTPSPQLVEVEEGLVEVSVHFKAEVAANNVGPNLQVLLLPDAGSDTAVTSTTADLTSHDNDGSDDNNDSDNNDGNGDNGDNGDIGDNGDNGDNGASPGPSTPTSPSTAVALAMTEAVCSDTDRGHASSVPTETDAGSGKHGLELSAAAAVSLDALDDDLDLAEFEGVLVGEMAELTSADNGDNDDDGDWGDWA